MKTKYVLISVPLLILLLYGLNTWWTNNLKKSGVRTLGQITYVSKVSYYLSQKPKKKVEYYQVDISFVANNGVIHGTKELTLTEYEKIKFSKGDKVELIYDKENPSGFVLGE